MANESSIESEKNTSPKESGQWRLGPRTPEGKARALANLRPPWTKATKPRGGRKPVPKIVSAALLAKLVRKRAKSVAEALIRQAEDGNVFAFNSLADRLEGKVAQVVQVEGSVDLAVRISAARARRGLVESVEAVAVDAVANPLLLGPGGPPAEDDSIDVGDLFGSGH